MPTDMWECRRCGKERFGCPPDDGICKACIKEMFEAYTPPMSTGAARFFRAHEKIEEELTP